MTKVLQENPLLLLFVVAAIGYPLGRISFRGASLGVAGYNLLVLGVLVTAASITATAHLLFSVSPAHTAGIFAGSLTNTPALAAVLDRA